MESTRIKEGKKILYGPWRLFLTFLFINLTLYIFGPWVYNFNDDKCMVLYIFVFALSSTIAYKMGIRNGENLNNSSSEIITIPTRLIEISIYISLVISLYMIAYGVSKNGIPKVSSIAANMAQAYSNGRQDTSTDKILAIQLYGNFSFFIYVTLILGVFYSKKLKCMYKILVICIYANLFVYFVVFNGTQKNIADIFIILLSVKYIEYKRTNKKIIFTKRVKGFMAAILIFCFFIYVLLGRATMMSFNEALYRTEFYNLNFNHWMIRWFPMEIQIAIGLAIFYLSHGFYGLSLCLSQPFVWTYGLASIPNAAVVITKFMRNSGVIDGLTYPERMQAVTGYPAFSVWHTAFPWIASDYTYFGAIIILSISAYIYAKAWREIIYYGKWQSILLFTMLNIQWLYITANNQLFTSRSTTMMFIISFILWIMRNNKIHIKMKK